MTPDYRFQADVIAEAERQLAAGEKVLLVSPTGSGKTVMGTEIVKAAVARRESVFFLAHRREIIAQTSQKLFKYGLRHGIIQAGFDPRPMERVQVASVATLFVRGVKSDAMRMPPADLIVIVPGLNAKIRRDLGLPDDGPQGPGHKHTCPVRG